MVRTAPAFSSALAFAPPVTPASPAPLVTATLGCLPFPNQAALFRALPQHFAAGCCLRANSLASWPRGNCTRKHSMPIAISSSACFAAAFSPASSRSYAMYTRLRAVLLKRFPVRVVEPVHAVAGRHVAIARAPERQRVDQRFAEDDVFRRDQRLLVPHAAPWPRQVQVILGSGPQMVEDLAPVHLHHVAVESKIGITSEPTKCSCPLFSPQDAQLLQPSALARTLDTVLIVQVVIQRTVGKPSLKCSTISEDFRPRWIRYCCAPGVCFSVAW